MSGVIERPLHSYTLDPICSANPHHNNSVRLVFTGPHQLEDIVRHVPRHIVHSARGRVAPDDRSL